MLWQTHIPLGKWDLWTLSTENKGENNTASALCCLYCLAGRFWSWKRSWRLWATIWNLWKSVSKRYSMHSLTAPCSHAATIRSPIPWPAVAISGLHASLTSVLILFNFWQFCVWFLIRVSSTCCSVCLSCGWSDHKARWLRFRSIGRHSSSFSFFKCPIP